MTSAVSSNMQGRVVDYRLTPARDCSPALARRRRALVPRTTKHQPVLRADGHRALCNCAEYAALLPPNVRRGGSKRLSLDPVSSASALTFVEVCFKGAHQEPPCAFLSPSTVLFRLIILKGLEESVPTLLLHGALG